MTAVAGFPEDYDEDAAYAELKQISQRSPRDWQDGLSLDGAKRIQYFKDWHTLYDMSWTKAPSAMERVGAILNFLAALAAPVTVITGGASGLVGLVGALKGL